MADEDDLTRWCRRLRASDRKAYAHVFETLYEPLYRYVCSITKDKEAAEDVTQDVFVRLWDAREELDPSQSLKAFLYRTARNLAYNHQRDRSTRSEKKKDVQRGSNVHPADPTPPDEVAQGDLLEERLRTWISDLPERQREALVLSRYEGLSHAEVADVMEISPRTVNNHIVRALKALRDCIQDYEPDLLNPHES